MLRSLSVNTNWIILSPLLLPPIYMHIFDYVYIYIYDYKPEELSP